MMVPPLSERPVTEEDEEQFRRESMSQIHAASAVGRLSSRDDSQPPQGREGQGAGLAAR